MMKFSCTMSSGSDIFYATVIAKMHSRHEKWPLRKPKKAGQGNGMSQSLSRRCRARPGSSVPVRKRPNIQVVSR